MNRLEIYEQSDCCVTGSVKDYVDFEKLTGELCPETYEVKRYFLEEAVQDFIRHPQIFSLLRENGNEVLPIALLDGQVIKTGSYPVLEDLEIKL